MAKAGSRAMLCKLPTVLDFIRLDYILDLLQCRGFPGRFHNWITAFLTTSSLHVLLNGQVSQPIKHGQGLREGNQLSPPLFVLAIDPLKKILDIATRHGLLHKLRGCGSILRTSLYADDAAIFDVPFREDIINLENRS
jgi:hypothetical protein